MGVDRLVIRRLSLLLLLISTAAFAQTVQITSKPTALVYGNLFVPVQTREPVVRVALFINGVKFEEKPGGSADFPRVIGDHPRRLRFLAWGYDAHGHLAL